MPDALVAARTSASFGIRAAERVADTTVAVVDGEVAGFVTGPHDGGTIVVPCLRYVKPVHPR